MRSTSIQPPVGARRARILAILAAIATIAAIDSLAMPGRGETTRPAETPRQFVIRLLDVYKPNGRWWRSSDTARGKREDEQYVQKIYAAFYDPSFSGLINRMDTVSAKWGDVFLDYDPVCQCQDSGGVYAVVSTNPRNAKLVDVRVREQNDKTEWTLVLTRGAGGWAVFDVVDSTGSLRALLSRQVACLEHARTQDQESHCS